MLRPCWKLHIKKRMTEKLKEAHRQRRKRKKRGVAAEAETEEGPEAEIGPQKETGVQKTAIEIDGLEVEVGTGKREIKRGTGGEAGAGKEREVNPQEDEEA